VVPRLCVLGDDVAKRLWENVPDSERANMAWFQDHWPGNNGEARVEKWLRLIAQPECAAAVRYPIIGGGSRWVPCGQPVQKGERFCSVHGGAGKLPCRYEIEEIAELLKSGDADERTRVMRALGSALRPHSPWAADILESWEPGQ
jgi:hypothetical protein